MDTNWSTQTRIFILVLIVIATVWLGLITLPLWESVGIAALFAILLNPLVIALMKRTRLPRSYAATIVFGLVLFILITVPTWLGSVAVNQVRGLSSEFQTAMTEIEDWLFQPIQILGYQIEAGDYIDNLRILVGDALANLPSGSLNILSSVTENLIWAVTIVVTLFYLLKEGTKIKPWLVASSPTAYQPEIDRLLHELDIIWSKFLRVQLFIFLVLTVLISIGTLLVVWLFRSGLVKWSPFGFIVLMLLVVTLAQQVDNLWMRPQLMGRTLQLHPGIVFVALLGALALTGVLGAIVIVPAVATVKVVGRYIHAKLLGLPPWIDEITTFNSSSENQESLAPIPVNDTEVPE
jgi:predicted PurR-regulated permease PerM